MSHDVPHMRHAYAAHRGKLPEDVRTVLPSCSYKSLLLLQSKDRKGRKYYEDERRTERPKLAELTEEELAQVSGGNYDCISKPGCGTVIVEPDGSRRMADGK